MIVIAGQGSASVPTAETTAASARAASGGRGKVVIDGGVWITGRLLRKRISRYLPGALTAAEPRAQKTGGADQRAGELRGRQR